MGSGASAVALDLLRAVKDGDDVSRSQSLRDVCATAFVGKSHDDTLTFRMIDPLKTQ